MGIGKTLAYELCKQGAQVVLNSRNAARLSITFKEFMEQKFNVIPIVADVTRDAECKDLIKKTLEVYGKIDVLVNNAGMSMNENFENLLPEVFDKIIQSNIHGSAFPTLNALPYLKQSKGSIIFISSAAGMVGLPTASAYSAGKMALTALAQSLKVELTGTGVHVGIVHVGFTVNDNSKRVYNATGELIPVAERPRYLQQTQVQVARAIMNTIQKRKFKVVLSLVGKLNAVIGALMPWLVLHILQVSQKQIIGQSPSGREYKSRGE